MTVSATTYSNSPSNLEAFDTTVDNTDDLVKLLQSGDVVTFDHQGQEFTLTLNPSTNRIELWSGQTLVDNYCQYNSTLGVDGFIELRNSSMLDHNASDALYLEVDTSGSFKVYDASHKLARTEKDEVLSGQDKSSELSNWTFYRPPTAQTTSPSETPPPAAGEVTYYNLNELQPGTYTVDSGVATDQSGNQFHVYNWPPAANYQINSDGSVQRLQNGTALNVDGQTGLVELQNGHLVPGIALSEHQIDYIYANQLADGSYSIDENGVISSSTDSTRVFGKTGFYDQAGTYKVSHANNGFEISRQASDGNFYAVDANNGRFNLVNGRTIDAVGSDLDKYSIQTVDFTMLPPGTYNMDSQGILVNSADNSMIMGTTQLYDQAGVYKISGSGNTVSVSRQGSDGNFYRADTYSGKFILSNNRVIAAAGADLNNYAINYVNFSDLQSGTYHVNQEGYIFSSSNNDLVYGRTFSNNEEITYKITNNNGEVTLQRQASDGNFYDANPYSGLYKLNNGQTIPAVGSDLSNYDLAYIDPTTLPAGSYTVTDDGTITSVQNLRTMIMGLSLVNLSAGHYNVKMTEKGAVIELV
ncbi:MAG TPA: hypothetical protein VFX23_15620 [Limnobacter sp.]|uniref:hypothetical protein n=1 Tax=Limnobacter sp. TaxID=2003368 RepID=UPI002E301E80|nr:hypothetical protein [Limnobacter sp.]HEX5487416.1 hypothetical protein [Limnobacter sp.]